MQYKISVCIPAYNRADLLAPLLDSILAQKFNNFEIVICEDNSPQRLEISRIVKKYHKNYPKLIFYYENQVNLGYDGNLRNLIFKASGDYCFFMGNDDLMAPNAILEVVSALKRHNNIGVVLRSYASFDVTPNKINQVFRYFEEERLFPKGPETISTFYRRSVVISGLVLNRSAALKLSTNRFDGYLLYQLYLVSRILIEMNGVFVPKILALYRNGGIPDFGHSVKERGHFQPKLQTPESSIYFMKGMLEIAQWIEKTQNIVIYKSVLTDIGNYCYPILSIQSNQPIKIFINYIYQLGRLGLWKNKMFYFYSILLIFFGSRNIDRIIRFIKKYFGYTPVIGKVYQGKI